MSLCVLMAHTGKESGLGAWGGREGLGEVGTEWCEGWLLRCELAPLPAGDTEHVELAQLSSTAPSLILHSTIPRPPQPCHGGGTCACAISAGQRPKVRTLPAFAFFIFSTPAHSASQEAAVPMPTSIPHSWGCPGSSSAPATTGEAGSSQLRPPALPSLAGALGTGERSGTGAEMLPRDNTVPTDRNKAVTNDMCWWPPRSPPAGSVVSDANLLQLITATATAAAAFTKSRGMPDYFHAPREPRGCVCTGCFPNISQGPACPGAGGCPKYRQQAEAGR